MTTRWIGRRCGGYTLIEVITALVIVATLIAIVIGIMGGPPVVESRRREDEPMPANGFLIRTRIYEGHWWVMYRESIAHHPDCPCRHQTAEVQQ